MEEIYFTIYGRVPSKKNSKWTKVINGRPIQLSSKKFQDWNKEKRKDVRAMNLSTLENVSEVMLKVYAPDKRAADLTNKAESIMDLLVDEGIIKDDNWFEIPTVVLRFMGVDKEEPRVEVIITYETNNIETERV